MIHAQRFFLLLAANLLAASFPLLGQSTPAPTPRALVEKAISLKKSDKPLPRYTYFKLVHTQNRTQKGKLFLDTTTLYEYTWIGDLPYGRVVELQGKPLKGKALVQEQARYDIDARAKIEHLHLVVAGLLLEPLLTPAYALTELRQETLAGNLTHVIDCTPVPSIDPAHPAATRHTILWVTDSGTILRDTYDVVADEPDRRHGSHGQEDYQLIDGNLLPLHDIFHLNAPNGNTGDFETTYTRYRRFNVTYRIVPADRKPGEPLSDHLQVGP